MRNIISDDDSLQAGVLPALREYNLTQFTTADVPGHQHQVCGFVLQSVYVQEKMTGDYWCGL